MDNMAAWIQAIVAIIVAVVSGVIYVEKTKADKIHDHLINAGIPSGAVMAFELAKCPRDQGWEEYNDAYGRFILGVGQGKDLSPRTLKATGGAEEVTLTETEIPKHQHKLPGGLRDNFNGGGGIRAPDVGHKWDKKVYTEVTGNGQGHENMPPFLALRYCIKK